MASDIIKMNKLKLQCSVRVRIRIQISLPYVIIDVALGGLVVSVLGPKVRGFDPDRGRWIFKGDKNP